MSNHGAGRRRKPECEEIVPGVRVRHKVTSRTGEVRKRSGALADVSFDDGAGLCLCKVSNLEIVRGDET